MIKFIARVLALTILALTLAHADTPLPAFADFPAQLYQGKIATVKIASAKDRQYRSRLRQSSGQKPNFAGHYTLTSWGCGASCVMAVAIDAETGRTAWLPFTVCCWDVDVDDPISFKADSRLVEIRGSRDESGGGTYFYALDKTGFTLVKAIEKQKSQ